MRLFFSILSIGYVFAIFFFARSSVVQSLSLFNPYSLLHIPLYGILAVFLTYSFFTFRATISKSRLWIPGLVALGVAIIDEIHQTFIPYRDGSLGDVVLDFLGILLVLLFIPKILKIKSSPTALNFTKHDNT